jgi:hypothetical protein
MKGRDKLFFNLLTFLLVVVIGLVGYRTKDVDKQLKKWQGDIKRRQERGVEDPALKEAVDRMETDLRARLAEEFALERDPLELTNVIKTRKFLESRGKFAGAESDTRMRLACTVTGEKGPSALVTYKGKNWVLMEGDKIAGYRVESIGINRVVLVQSGERLVLITEKAPDTKAAEERLYGPGGEKLPVIEVKQVSTGNN